MGGNQAEPDSHQVEGPQWASSLAHGGWGASYCPTLGLRGCWQEEKTLSDVLSPPPGLTQPSPRVPGPTGLSGFPKLWPGAEKL